MNKAELARELGVSRAYITMLEQGKRKPSRKLTRKLNKLTIPLPDSYPKSCSSANSDTPPNRKSARFYCKDKPSRCYRNLSLAGDK